MPKIIEEAKQLGTVKLNDGREIPKMSCRSETLITNTKTGYEYSSEEEVKKDIDNSETETKEEVSTSELSSAKVSNTGDAFDELFKS